MYRKKFMIILTLSVAGLLGTMIWSSNIVADDHAKTKTEAETSENVSLQNSDIENDNTTPILQEENIPEEEAVETQSESTIEVSEDQNAPKSVGDGVYIDKTVIEPEIPEYYPHESIVKTHYLDQLGENNLVLWNTSTFPLSVYVKASDKINVERVNDVQKVLKSWQDSSQNFIKFQEAANYSSADIVVNIVDKQIENCSEECKLSDPFVITGKILKRAEFTISTVGCDGKELLPYDFYAKLQHNIGHVIGLNFHSNRSYDIMAQTLNYKNKNISSNDIETLRLLYKLKPEITNRFYTNNEAKNLLEISEIKGKSNSEITDILTTFLKNQDLRLIEYEKILKNAEDFYQQGKYKEAISEYDKASNYVNNKYDEAYINNAKAISYIKIGDKNIDAYSSAMQAQKYGNIYATYTLAYLKYIMSDEEEALNILTPILQKKSRFKPAYALAGQIYYKNARIIELSQLAEQAKSLFYMNPPLSFDRDAYEKAYASQYGTSTNKSKE